VSSEKLAAYKMQYEVQDIKHLRQRGHY